MVAGKGDWLCAGEVCPVAVEERSDFALENASEMLVGLDARHIGDGAWHGECLLV